MAYVPQDVLDRIAALEREVRQLRGRASMRPALNQIVHGDLVVGEGGRLLVRAPGGPAVFETGQSPTAGDYFTMLRRDTGAQALSIGANTYPGDDAPTQMIRMWDRSGNAIVMDDYHADRFLGRPWMPVQLHPTGRQSHSGTSYEQAWVGTSPAHNAVLRLSLTTWAGTGGGQTRVVLTADGTDTTLAEWDSPAGQWTGRVITHPLHGLGFLDDFSLRVDNRARTAGQTVETCLYYAYTRNTRTANDTPNAPTTTADAPPPALTDDTP
ncbi:hypothetical protein [Streptomyces sp. TP-A0875]|uniref:hypothetical protein n=1 Tax=Streptomyces sp. TP-A0875 TaxID=552354 RepID=UPI0006B68D22|nr:hypothetical protein [Streptomyces sp. TP-A0875]